VVVLIYAVAITNSLAEQLARHTPITPRSRHAESGRGHGVEPDLFHGPPYHD
jgi:hypothetical protein